MIGSFGGWLEPPSFKPYGKWIFVSHPLSGINAYMGYEGSDNMLRLPSDLTDEQRDLILWAYERGFKSGEFWGKNDLRVDFKRLMNLDGFA